MHLLPLILKMFLHSGHLFQLLQVAALVGRIIHRSQRLSNLRFDEQFGRDALSIKNLEQLEGVVWVIFVLP